jgi:hypothetical protein
MKRLTAIFLILIFPIQIMAADVVFKKSKVVVFAPGKDGETEQKERKALVTFGDDKVVIQGLKTEYAVRTEIPYTSITQTIYERSSHSRVATAILFSPLALFVKRKHHWFTFSYTAPDSSAQTLLLRLDKKDEKRFRQVSPQRTGAKLETIVE